MTAPSVEEQRAIQRRTVVVLSTGQVLGGIAFGVTLSLGALLATDISGDEALSGLATASVTLGAALCAIPLAGLAARRGRRIALTLGNVFALVGIGIVILAAALRSFPLLLIGVVLIGAGNAGNLQARFAATDIALPVHRGRDLSIVVWATTVGGVSGPLLVGPGEALGQAIGMPPQTGAYLFALVAQAGALLLYILALRPDPLLLAKRMLASTATQPAAEAGADRTAVAYYAMLTIAGAHVVMVAVMAMTPLHLAHIVQDAHHGHAVSSQIASLVGITIAAHVAGMYGLSPLFGIISDRWGRLRVVLIGQALLVLALGSAFFAGSQSWGVMVALILLGLGWSASTVAGAALLTEATAPALRARRQGRSDSLMSFCGAGAAVLAGIVMSNFGYAGLAAMAAVVVIVVVVLSPRGRMQTG